MSMNLYFYSKIHNLDIDFPIQTPTKLSYEVLREKNKDRRMDILKHYIEDTYFFEDEQKEILRKIRKLLDDENLELCVG